MAKCYAINKNGYNRMCCTILTRESGKWFIEKVARRVVTAQKRDKLTEQPFNRIKCMYHDTKMLSQGIEYLALVALQSTFLKVRS